MSGKGIVYLVGSGPGDPDLITVKGMECIKKADVLVYDRLAGESFLHCARQGAELKYVGKAPGQIPVSQKDINKLLVEEAGRGKVVTRLKGGDPFVFGRGAEEAGALAKAGIAFEIVPGISSAIAAPAYAGIPVTKRGLSSSFLVLTGNEDPEKGPGEINWEAVANTGGTIVLLMGMANLELIARRLMDCGRPKNTPAAVVMWGTRTNQRTVADTLENIAYRVKEQGLTNPAVVVVGEVVRERDKLAWYEKKPLSGLKVLVTRPRGQSGDFIKAIREYGGDAVEFPTISIAEPDGGEELDMALKRLGEFRWIAFTSVNGVEHFFRVYLSGGRDIRDLKGIRFGVVGPATGKELLKMGIRADYMPGEFTTQALAAGIAALSDVTDIILLPRSDLAGREMPQLLMDAGLEVEEVAVYKTLPAGKCHPDIREEIRRQGINAVTFTSPSTVRNFVRLTGSGGLAELTEGMIVACIGPVTAMAAAESGMTVKVLAGEYTSQGLLKSLAEYWLSGRQEYAIPFISAKEDA